MNSQSQILFSDTRYVSDTELRHYRQRAHQLRAEAVSGSARRLLGGLAAWFRSLSSGSQSPGSRASMRQTGVPAVTAR